MTEYAFGIDLSRYNYSQDGKIKMDFDQVAAHKDPPVSFVAIRSGISWGYTDPWFSRSWAEAKRVSLCRMAYHVLYFGESAQAQADHMFRIVEPTADWTHDRLVLDLEVEHQNSQIKITDTTLKVMEICRSRTGRYPINYSRAEWINRCLVVKSLPPETDWWLAQYFYARPYPLYTPEYPSDKLTMPKGVTRWLVHQSAERGKSIGTTAMHYMDYNRWNGSVIDVLKYFNHDEPEQPVEPSDTEKLNKLWNAHKELH